MKKLLSLPPNVASVFHDITHLTREEYFCTCDPAHRKLGSGGGTAWLLAEAHAGEGATEGFLPWLGREKRILLHAGGHSRRLPAYAPGGKVLTPVPVFRWARGQRIDQTLLDQQVPLYESILQRAPEGLHTLIASGDVLLRATEPLQPIPEADVVCYGLWADPAQAAHHGVFMMNRNQPTQLDFMLQKPSTSLQAELMETHLSLMDIGVWLLSDKAVERLMQKAAKDYLVAPTARTDANLFSEYDLYSEFGCGLGLHPSQPDPLLADLTVAVLPLPGGEFYHFGTNEDMIASSVAIQNLVRDQRYILQRHMKLQTSVFTQNSLIANLPTDRNSHIWIENSNLGKGWRYSHHHIVTGVPGNDWEVDLQPGQCVDVVPIGESAYALRPYGFSDAFKGAAADPATQLLGQPLAAWLSARGIAEEELGNVSDLQFSVLFPVSDDLEVLGRLLCWFLADAAEGTAALAEGTALWRSLPRLSAAGLSQQANLPRLTAQRSDLQAVTIPLIAKNWRRSVFYQVNLKDLAAKYAQGHWPLPEPLPADAPLMKRVRDAMFRSEVARAVQSEKAQSFEAQAFSLLRQGLTENVLQHRCTPKLSTYADQIVWGRSSVRIDIAGGWTDTPPYCLGAGGNVVNVAIELNGQPPLQVYVKPCSEPVVKCRSIDLGALEVIETYEQLQQFNKVGSPFSIPKAALALAGFLPDFCTETHTSLRQQLEHFGCGIEITLLAAIPAGSGLGTSSVLAATVLGALSDFCGLGWDKGEVCNRTLVLEQLLTTGGGWQDQYGGVLGGVKLLQTNKGYDQSAVVRWLPDNLFTDPELQSCHLLYYTGITRTAKQILAEIVRGMFLNNSVHLSLLDEMKLHALTAYDAIQCADLERYGRVVRTTWEQNKTLDAGTSTLQIENLCRRIDDLCYGYKLPGAGGGGFMYMVAKDLEAATRIRRMLKEQPLTPNARFVDMTISKKGLQVSRS